MTSGFGIGPINVEGCACNDFQLTNHLPPEKATAVIERDRLLMSARPGFNRKLLPLGIEVETGKAYSGGRYLFDSYEDIQAFADWCHNDFIIDGVTIFDRPDFTDVKTRIFRVIGAHDFKDLHSAQTAFRTEIWQASAGDVEDKLVNLWPSLRDRAEQEGKSSLWLLHNAEMAELALVTVVDRIGTPSQTEPDFNTLGSLQSAPSYSDEWSWADKTFDRSHWVYTIWFPNTNDASAIAPLWPNSPPLPAPENWMQKSTAA